VCIFDAAAVEALSAAGHPITPGDVGENLLLSGLPWAACARPGARFSLGARGGNGNCVVLEITEVTSPCASTKGGFLKGNNSLMDERKHPGGSRWYARVLTPGWVAVGDEVRWTRAPTTTEARE
jgi:MOSC domain-containing protein YiiM